PGKAGSHENEVAPCWRTARLGAQGKEAVKNPEKTDGNDNASCPDVDEKEIFEAYDIDMDKSEQCDDMFSSYDGDDMDAGPNFYSSENEMESKWILTLMMTSLLEEGTPVLALLQDAGTSSVLKASFEALSGISGVPESVEKSGGGTGEEKNTPTCFSKCTGHTPVSHGRLRVLPLYAMLPASQQLQVFEDIPQGERLVVVATNVAETSLTILGIKYVVDTGKEKWISRASASQRAGRAGRTGPGHCYRLYSAAAYGKDDLFPEFAEPEIKKIPVEGVVLMLKFMCIDKVENFPFPTPPNKESLVEADQCLKTLEALDSSGKLTPMGKAMAQYPVSPRLLLTVIKILKNQQGFARPNLMLGYAAAAASALSFTNPFLKELDECDTNDESEENNTNPEANDPRERKRQKKTQGNENPVEFCRVNSIHLKTMEEMSKLRKQLCRLIFHHSIICKEFSWNYGDADDVEQAWRSEPNKRPLQMDEEELLRQGICAGWADRVARRTHTYARSSEDGRKVRAVRYQSCALNEIIYMHRSSSVAQVAPELVVYSELLNSKRLYMHGVTSVEPGWLLKYASSLCTFSEPLEHPKPFYDPLNDQVCCYVSTIFSRHNWQLPLHSFPIEEHRRRLQVFACALLKGNVLPCLQDIKDFLALSPYAVLDPASQPRVGDLLKRMKIVLKSKSGPESKNDLKLIDSRAALGDVWNVDLGFLYHEIKACYQAKFHSQFDVIWEQMHQQVLLQGHKLSQSGPRKLKVVTLGSLLAAALPFACCNPQPPGSVSSSHHPLANSSPSPCERSPRGPLYFS
ncbi:hypothetical protein U9M48_022071, partial [Paspalum notatum var. saurae]